MWLTDTRELPLYLKYDISLLNNYISKKVFESNLPFLAFKKGACVCLKKLFLFLSNWVDIFFSFFLFLLARQTLQYNVGEKGWKWPPRLTSGFISNSGALQFQEFPGSALKVALVPGGQGKTKERGRSLQIGRWQF